MQLGNFATAEEAALCFTRSPEGQAAAAGNGAVGRESGKALCRAVRRGSRGSLRNARKWTVSRLLRGEAEQVIWHHR